MFIFFFFYCSTLAHSETSAILSNLLSTTNGARGKVNAASAVPRRARSTHFSAFCRSYTRLQASINCQCVIMMEEPNILCLGLLCPKRKQYQHLCVTGLPINTRAFLYILKTQVLTVRYLFFWYILYKNYYSIRFFYDYIPRDRISGHWHTFNNYIYLLLKFRKPGKYIILICQINCREPILIT